MLYFGVYLFPKKSYTPSKEKKRKKVDILLNNYTFIVSITITIFTLYVLLRYLESVWHFLQESKNGDFG